MSRGSTIGVVLVAATMTSPVVAQSSPARQTQEIFNVSNKESDYFEHTFRHSSAQVGSSYVNALRFASCAAKLNPNAAAAVLAADAGTAIEERALKNFTKRYGTCAITRDSMSPVVVRGAVAEALWKHGGGNPNPAKRSTVDIEDVEVFIKAAPLGEQKLKSANLPLSWVSRCQVMALPEDSAKVLAAQPGSKEEIAAAQALYVKSNVCGVVKGLEDTPATFVRAGLADAFYQDSRRATLAGAQ